MEIGCGEKATTKTGTTGPKMERQNPSTADEAFDTAIFRSASQLLYAKSVIIVAYLIPRTVSDTQY